MLQVEQAAAAEGATLADVLAVLTWHLVESAAFIGLLRAEYATVRREELGRAGSWASGWSAPCAGSCATGARCPPVP